MMLILTLSGSNLRAQDERLEGDLDGDGVVTVRDVARLVSFIRGNEQAGELQRSIADVNQDGALNALDRAELVRKILGSSDPEQVPPCRVATSSPADGEALVAVTRETVLHFSMPLALESAIGHEAFYADFGSRRLLSRVELSGDRRKATLFYLEPLPPRARIRVSLDGAGLIDLLGRPLDLDHDGVPGGIYQTSFETLSTSPVGGTAIMGTVLASEVSDGPGGSTDVPLAGVTITVDGAEETMRAVTDAQGNFVLDPSPSGTFFVHIDGRTSPLSNWPDGAYYPSVGKKWFADGARKDNLAGSPGDSPTGGTGIIYLPYVRAGTLQAVSLTEETEVGFPAEILAQHPEWSGVRLKVPANSLFSDDGTRGGRIGMAPVPPERLPSPLPPGLNPALVITIQTDGGTNFDQAVPVEFPNLPDPDSGLLAPSGAPRSIFSFNHDTGDWEIVGGATVSDDGLRVVSDPGVGIRQPGWHFPDLPRSEARWGGAREMDDSDASADCGGAEFTNALVKIHEHLKVAMLMAQPLAAIEGIPDRVRCAEDWLAALENLATAAEQARIQLPTVGVSVADLGGLDAIQTAEACLKNPLNVDVVAEIIAVLDQIAGEVGPLVEECQALENRMKAACIFIDSVVDLCEKLSAFQSDVGVGTASRFRGPLISRKSTDRLIQHYDNLVTSAGAKTGPLSDEDIAELRALMLLVRIEARTISNPSNGLREVAGNNQDLIRQLRELLQLTSMILDQLASKPTGKTWWALDIGEDDLVKGSPDTIVLRGQVSGGDGASIFVPMDTPYNLSIYRHGGNKLGGHGGNKLGAFPGVTAGANEITVIPPTPVFGESELGPKGAFADLEMLGKRIYRYGSSDLDSIPDPGEFVIGTDPNDEDTDGDGDRDDNELIFGNPLGQGGGAVGIIGNLATERSQFRDIAAGDGFIATANGENGISIFDISDPINPGQAERSDFDTSAGALAIAVGGNYVAVAVGNGGLQIFDRTEGDTSAPELFRVRGVTTTAVDVLGETAFVGSVDSSNGGRLDVVDLGTAEPIAVNISLGPEITAIDDIRVYRGVVYVVATKDPNTPHELLSISIPENFDDPAAWEITSRVQFPGRAPQLGHRIGLANKRLYVSTRESLLTYDIGTNPLAPTLMPELVPPGPLFWKSITPNGSGLALGFAGTALFGDVAPGLQSLYLFNLGSDEQLFQFLYEIQTDGNPVAATVLNGLGYVADRWNGLLVANYLGRDTANVPPTMTFDSNFPLDDGKVGKGQWMRLTAETTDDFQVARVEFEVPNPDGGEGSLTFVDFEFPFETFFQTPVSLSITIKATAFDTANNPQELTMNLTGVDDAINPRVNGHIPSHDDLITELFHLQIKVSELIAQDGIKDTVSLLGAGPDGAFFTADDIPVQYATRFRPESKMLFLSPEAPLPPGKYRTLISSALTDPSGNPLLVPFSSDFEIVSDEDLDEDGIPDAFEGMLGLNPALKDSDGDGIPDGLEDFDNDGLPNAAEVLLKSKLKVADSDGDGIPDGDEDSDGDGLTDGREFLVGTDLLKQDTDDDGWKDETEVTAGSDPFSPASTPLLLARASGIGPPASVFPRVTTSDPLARGATITRDETEVLYRSPLSDPLAVGATGLTPGSRFPIPSSFDPSSP